MCNLNKSLFLNREFSLAAVRILAGNTFSFEKQTLATYIKPELLFLLFLFMRAHLSFCCLVSGNRAKLFTCQKVVAPTRVTLSAEEKQLASSFVQRRSVPTFSVYGSTRSLSQMHKRASKITHP